MKLLSPAKVNLFLRVLSKRPDGYHEIETLFERVGLFDEITLSVTQKKIRVLSDNRSLPTGPKNIAHRAAVLLKDKYGIQKGVVIRIKKRIPISAGLGGGSSNAATVLMGLNRLWKLRLSTKELMSLGATLGSDVPFFLMDTSFALAAGRGEKLKKVSFDGPRIWHCLVKPPFGISTKEAYQTLPSSALTPQKADVKMLLHSIHKGQSEGLTKLLINSLELALNKRVIEISKIKKELLRKGALGCLLSGSGSCVFGIFKTEKEALVATRFFNLRKNYKAFTASTF